MWMSDPSGGVSQSMLIGLGMWVAFAYLWTFAPRFGVRRDVAVAGFGAGGVGGAVGARVMWWISQGLGKGGSFFDTELLLEALNPMNPGYSSLGFLAGAGVVVCSMDRWVDIDKTLRGRLLDVVVLAGFLGLGFARLGCVFNGCDFGRISSEYLFSIRYARGSLAWEQHRVEGLIDSEQMWSMPTHGFALYSAGATFLAVVAVSLWAFRPQNVGQKPGGMAARRAVVIFCCLQFVVEFLRESPFEGNLVLQPNINQMALLGALMFVGILRIIGIASERERHREV